MELRSRFFPPQVGERLSRWGEALADFLKDL